MKHKLKIYNSKTMKMTEEDRQRFDKIAENKEKSMKMIRSAMESRILDILLRCITDKVSCALAKYAI